LKKKYDVKGCEKQKILTPHWSTLFIRW